MSLIEDLSWRYACQAFQPGARADGPLSRALAAARLAPSAFGVQPWRIVEIDAPDLRRDLPDLCYGQVSVREAGHLLAFAICDPLTRDHLQDHSRRVAAQRGLDPDQERTHLEGLIKTLLARQSPEELRGWSRAQCYLGLGLFLAACAQLRLDTCPMEGFQPGPVAAHLGLDRMGLAPVVLVAVGRRAPWDSTAAAPKVRVPQQAFHLRLGGEGPVRAAVG